VPAGVVVVAALAFARPAALRAQDRLLYLPLDSATAVRLRLTDGRRVTGRLVRPFGPDSTRFVYCPGQRARCPAEGAGAVRHTPASDVTRVETRRGSRASHGAALGAVGAVAAASAFCAVTDTGGCDPAKGGFFSYVLLPAALVGAGVGAIVGGSIAVWGPAP
jgi:hypothetical protein